MLHDSGMTGHAGRTETLEACISACLDCLQECEYCATACLTEDPAMLAECIRTCRDCADTCSLCAHLLARNSDLQAEICPCRRFHFFASQSLVEKEDH